MAFQVSPGVLVQERDLTNIIPAVSTSIGAVAGQFAKGPLRNSPAMAPIDVETAGIILVKSLSCTRTPGDT